jgi:type VI secretion system protein ImpK
MTPKFSSAVDPIFLHVLGLLDRIGRDENPSPTEERAKIQGYLAQAEARLGQTPDWALAKYAMVSWIDDVLFASPWEASARDWWANNALEVEFFNLRVSYVQFYMKAKEASSLPQKDALETFYVCVVLGFRGIYGDPVAAAAQAEDHQLPPDLETWARQTAMAIQLGQGRPPLTETADPIEGAPPLDGPFILIWALLFGLILVVGVVLLAFLIFSLQKEPAASAGNLVRSLSDLVISCQTGVDHG